VTSAGPSATVAYPVSISAEDAARFSAAVGVAGTDRLPTTLPVLWLAQPQMADAIRRLAADRPQALPVHELQTIEVMGEIPLGRPLSLTARITRTDADRITVEALAADEAAGPVVRLHAVLRLAS